MDGSHGSQAQRQGRPKFGGTRAARISSIASSSAVNGPCLVAGPMARACAANLRERPRSLDRDCNANPTQWQPRVRQGHGRNHSKVQHTADTAKTQQQHGTVDPQTLQTCSKDTERHGKSTTKPGEDTTRTRMKYFWPCGILRAAH